MCVTASYFSQVPATPRLLLIETADETAVDEATSLNRQLSFGCHDTDHDCHVRECNNDCHMRAHMHTHSRTEMSHCLEGCKLENWGLGHLRQE